MHTIFGHVIENGMDIVNKIVVDDAINSVKIIRKGEAAKKFDALKIFDNYYKIEAETLKKQALINDALLKKSSADKLAFFAQIKASAIKLPSGLSYTITQKGKGLKSTNRTNVLVNYAGFLENGILFDTSDAAIAKSFGKFDVQREAQGDYSPIPFTILTKGGMIPGFKEGLSKMNIGDKAVLFIPSNLAYGENGAGNVIPPNANIIFEVEIVNTKM